MKTKKKIDSEEFANIAYRNGTTYAKAQMEESKKLMTPIKVPEGYTKIGDRVKKKAEE